MTRLSMHRTYDAPASVVWAVVTDPDVYAAVAPNLTAVELLEEPGPEMVRRCVDTNGNVWKESCERWEAGRGFAVAVDTETSDFHRRLFTRFEGAWDLTETDDGVEVTIQFDFDTKYGPVGWLVARYFEYKAPSLVEAIFDGWAAEIDERRTGPGPRTADDGETEATTGTNRLFR